MGACTMGSHKVPPHGYIMYTHTTRQPDTQPKQYKIRAAHIGSNIQFYHWLTCVEVRTQQKAVSNFVVARNAHCGCDFERVNSHLSLARQALAYIHGKRCLESRLCWVYLEIHSNIIYSRVFPVNCSNPCSKYYTLALFLWPNSQCHKSEYGFWLMAHALVSDQLE